MDLIKKNIHMNRQKGRAISQLTLDNDFNVPDNKHDIEMIIQQKGKVEIDEIHTSGEAIDLRGNFLFTILYLSDRQDRELSFLEGRIPFEERINIEGVSEGDNIEITSEIEDLSSDLINSRKVNVRTIITFQAAIEELFDEEVALEVHGEDMIETKTEPVDLMQIAVKKKDIYRIKDEIILDANKENIYEILWDSIQTRNIETRILDNKISLQGELLVFILYKGDDENHTMQWIEESIPVSALIDCEGCREDMVSDIDIRVSNRELEVRPDFDGEERVVGVDVILELNMKMYEEEHLDVLSDLYGISKVLIPNKSPGGLESLLVKNDSKCRLTDRMKINNNQARILQLCHNEGEVKIDDINMINNGLEIEGILIVPILYITSDDNRPFGAAKGMIPFRHVIDTANIDADCTYKVKSNIEQLSIAMVDSEEVELRAILNLQAIVFKKLNTPIIRDITQEDIDIERLQDMPGITCYLPKPGDTLWDIGKEYNISLEGIRQMNNLTSDNFKPGEGLIIVKEMKSFQL